MTCIVGIVDDSKVYMGADSCASNGDTFSILKGSKICRLNDQILIGVSGKPRAFQLISYKGWLPVYEPGNNLMGYMCTTFVDSLRALFSENGYSEVINNKDEFFDTLMVGIRGRIFEVECNYQVIESERKYSAIGSGMDFALGSLHTQYSYETPLDGPDQRVLLALQAAAEFSCGVREPFVIESI